MRVSTLSSAVPRRRLAALACAVLAGAALPVTGFLAGPASAANSPFCMYGTATATCAFAYSATGYSWTVPTGVNTLNVTADGGSGQGVGFTPGGAGAVFRATLTGTSGKTLTVTTGGAGAGTAGGNGGGGTGGSSRTNGGGGGGATVLSSGPTLIVAAGGGGAASGNNGGNAGTSSAILPAATTGANGSSSGAPFSTGGGGGSTLTLTGGAAGLSPACTGATAGAPGLGGNGANCPARASAGGGGGGGYYGGGGGGNSSGGGGGSSFPAATFTTAGGITVTPLAGVATNRGNGSVVITYVLIPTATLLTSSPNPSDQGDSVTLTATVSPTDGNGTVTFYDHFRPIRGCVDVPITHVDQASCDTSTLPTGTNPLTAVYSGDPLYGTSTSNTVDQVVLINTTTTLTSRPNPSTYGENVRFTATVSPSDGGGTVTFKNSGVPITGCSNLPLIRFFGSYQATCNTSTLPVGTSPVTAVYSGDAAYAGSTSNTVEQVVNPDRTSLRTSGQLTGNGIILSAQLTGDGMPFPGQLITFTAGPGGFTVCTATTNGNGVATCQANSQGAVYIALNQGLYRASYAGTTDDQSSTAVGVVNGL